MIKSKVLYGKRVVNSKILEYSGQAIYNEEGNLIYAILVFQDISQEERNREKISQLEDFNRANGNKYCPEIKTTD